MKIPKQMTNRARALRQNQSDAETRIWSLLRDRRFEGIKFRRQQPLDGFILDFYCSSIKLCIELDGGQHFEPEAEEYDRRRTDVLEKNGVTVLRFDNHQVMCETDSVMERIYEVIELLRSKHL